MDWKLIGTTFAAVFLAELGDKTQIATMTLAGSERSRLSVFAGSALALTASAALAVLVGGAVGKWLSPTVVRRGAGLVFLLLGLHYLLARVPEA
jgi:putative Ca2+/H+ antiporter (TMEM165/GDT1 family)